MIVGQIKNGIKYIITDQDIEQILKDLDIDRKEYYRWLAKNKIEIIRKVH